MPGVCGKESFELGSPFSSREICALPSPGLALGLVGRTADAQMVLVYEKR